MVKILVKKFDKNIKLPAYKTSGSSGMDLVAYIKKKIIINPGKTAMLLPEENSLFLCGADIAEEEL